MISADLGHELQTVVAELVDRGRFASENEVLREGVRLVQEREARLAELHASIDRGLADVRAGRVRDADEVFDELEAKYSRMIADAA